MKKHRAPGTGLRILLGLLILLALVVFVNFLPTFRLRTSGMSSLEGQHVRVYYETLEAAAQDVFALAEERGSQLKEQQGVPAGQRIDIYLYDRQTTLQRKKYGYITGLLGLDWYIGDNVAEQALLLSPAGDAKEHSYQEIRQAVLHEMVHAYNHLVNPDMTYFLDNGIAGYLSEQTPSMYWERMKLPTFKDTQVSGLLAPLQFARYDGYAFSYMYVAYLEQTYGWQAVKGLLHTGNYEAAFGRSEAQIYDEWAEAMAVQLGVMR